MSDYKKLDYLKSIVDTIPDTELVLKITHCSYSPNSLMLEIVPPTNTLLSSSNDILTNLVSTVYSDITPNFFDLNFSLDREAILESCLHYVYSCIEQFITYLGDCSTFSLDYCTWMFVKRKLDPAAIEGLIILYEYIRTFCDYSMKPIDGTDIRHIKNAAYIYIAIYKKFSKRKYNKK